MHKLSMQKKRDSMHQLHPSENGYCSNKATIIIMLPKFKNDEFDDLPIDQTFACNTFSDTFTDSKMKTAFVLRAPLVCRN